MSEAGTFRVMLVDDHPVVRKGLRDLLEDAGGFEVVAEATDGVEAVRAAEESRPDVVVMDVMMPERDGVEACREIVQRLPETKVIMLTVSTGEDAVVGAVAAGATGFVQKHAGSEELVEAIRGVAGGRLTLPDHAVRRVFELMSEDGELRSGPGVLTAREREVLRHYAAGKPYAAVAESLGVSTITVRNTIYRIEQKLGVGSKQEIVVWAARNGLLDDDGG